MLPLVSHNFAEHMINFRERVYDLIKRTNEIETRELACCCGFIHTESILYREALLKLILDESFRHDPVLNSYLDGFELAFSEVGIHNCSTYGEGNHFYDEVLQMSKHDKKQKSLNNGRDNYWCMSHTRSSLPPIESSPMVTLADLGDINEFKAMINAMKKYIYPTQIKKLDFEHTKPEDLMNHMMLTGLTGLTGIPDHIWTKI